jgi:hypothetical protein
VKEFGEHRRSFHAIGLAVPGFGLLLLGVFL